MIRNPVKVIIEQVVAKHGVTFDLIKSHDRKRSLIIPRRELMWRLYRETKLSLTGVGRMLDRDHTSVMHGVRNYQAIVDSETAQIHQEAA